MSLGYDRPLYMLAFDHRTSFERMLGISGRAPTAEEEARIAAAKELIFEGFERALEDGVDRRTAAVLVDTQYGAEVARHAHRRGVPFAIALEKSGQQEFELEHGERLAEVVEALDPPFLKVLVRYNVEGDAALNRRQAERLRALSDWVRERGRKLLFELLVPAEPGQLARTGGEADRYDAELRPQLMLLAIEELQDAGVEPDVWKIEGIDERERCREIAELVRREGRAGVGCVVLGRGASKERVDAWLRAASGLPGYIGFAIGRSIFAEALADASADRETRVGAIAENYRRFVRIYERGLRSS